MTEYEYVKKRFSPSGANRSLEETVEVLPDAIGVTLSTWGMPESKKDPESWVSVRYLVPVEET